MVDECDYRWKQKENLILLLLGAVPDALSEIHIVNDIFILSKFHPTIQNFIKCSEGITDMIHYPYLRTGSWECSSGYIKLTEKGKAEYEALYQEMMSNEEMHSLLTGIYIVRKLYDKMAPKEFDHAVFITRNEVLEWV